MFSQFQTQYPMGSLISELLQIHDGNYVVRTVVQVGSMTLATGMAAAPEIHQAEDQSRIRALAVLGIHPTQAHRIVSPEVETPALASQSLGSNPLPSDQQEETLASQAFSHHHTTDLSIQEVAQLSAIPSTSRPLANSDLLSHLDPDSYLEHGAEKHGSHNGRVATQSNQAIPQNGKPLRPVDLSDVIAQTSVELKRLDWSDVQGRSYLQRIYGKRSRQQLTDQELLEFLDYLQSQPSANEPSF